MWKAQQQETRLNFALVIEEADGLRSSIVSLLRECGWLVHGVSRPEQAFSILAHIPYNLIVLDSELPGMGGIDFVRIMRNARKWQKIRRVVMMSSNAAGLTSEAAVYGTFLARKSMWKDDLLSFLRVYDGEVWTSNVCTSDLEDLNEINL